MKPAPSFGVGPADHMAEPARDERADDTEDDGNDAAAGVLARHQELRNRASEAATPIQPISGNVPSRVPFI